MNITIIIGLPASGKTHYGESLGIPFFDDATDLPKDMTEDFAISHPIFCIMACEYEVKKRIRTEYPDAQLRCVYFANNPKQCKENAKLRDRVVNGYIDYLTQKYHPMGKIIPVFDPNTIDMEELRAKGPRIDGGHGQWFSHLYVDKECTHPARKGSHEIYMRQNGSTYCRACGLELTPPS